MGIFSQFLFLSLMAVWFISLAAYGTKTIHPDESKIYIVTIAIKYLAYFLILMFQFFYLRGIM